MIRNLSPKQSFTFMQVNTAAVLIDVRTHFEYSLIGHPLNALSIAWKEAPNWQENPIFLSAIEKAVPNKNTPILLLCRSGHRSFEAAKKLEASGYQYLINIEEGFEGNLDSNKHRGNIGGWRYHGLPWEQS
jgi:rhodanese-related sulfurtransferase